MKASDKKKKSSVRKKSVKKRVKKTVKKKASPKPRKKAVEKITPAEKNVLYKNKRSIAAGILIAVFFLIALAVLIGGGKKGEIILVVDSSACRCIKVRCESVEKQVKNLLETEKVSGRIKLSVYDKAKDKKAEAIMDKYEISLVPHLVFIDNKGAVIYNANAYRFRFKDIRDKIKTNVKGEL